MENEREFLKQKFRLIKFVLVKKVSVRIKVKRTIMANFSNTTILFSFLSMFLLHGKLLKLEPFPSFCNFHHELAVLLGLLVSDSAETFYFDCLAL